MNVGNIWNAKRKLADDDEEALCSDLFGPAHQKLVYNFE